MIRETGVLVERELKKWVGRRGTFFISLITPVAWLALFGKSLNFVNMFSAAGLQAANPIIVKQYIDQTLLKLFGTTDYFSYLATGMFVVFAFFQSVFGGVNIVFEKRLGSMNRLRMTPAPRSSIFFAKMIATLIRSFFYETVLLVIAIALGFSLDFNVLNFVEAGVAIALLSMSFISVFEAIGFSVDNQEVMFSIVNLVNLPLMFASPALFPLRQMPWWLQDIARFNPITYTVDIVRYNLLGLHSFNIVEDWVILLGITVVFVSAGMFVSLKILENY
ncbi:ABC transporter permease [Acidilobus sp. 7A]|jgi:ABC-2 type transport system permease protein|uniref:ABC transporter permease n=1 Tax=Acidilobus sp. 7A TaxID=1577685 RepID=UPI000764E271|nr:ABC transporter permease [Acidilobus sp. 7A]AMD30814.1 ABC transporter permease [Acidilobus sp. 7A]